MTVGTMLTTPDQITMFHILAMRGALRLEIHGLKHSSGRSVYAHVKKVFGFRGNKQKVLDQLNAYIEEKMPKAEHQEKE